MERLDVLENQRLDQQSRLDSRKSGGERNILGQFATPPGLALEIAKYVAQLWRPSNVGIRFLDPAVGTGSFFGALKRAAGKRIEWAKGIEIDQEFVLAARRVWDREGLKVKSGDFTKLEPPKRGKPNLVLTNPPYVRHHHLQPAEKVRLQALVARRLGYKISGLSGLYAYFILLAHDWLDADGLGVWLIPSEFMDVNYGTTIRRYLTEHVTVLHIHRFDAADTQFDDALVSSAVVVFRRTTPIPETPVQFTYGGSLLNPKAQRVAQLGELKGGHRWTRWSHALADETRRGQSTILADLFEIKRGIATGANEFFILPRQKAKELNLPEKFLRPILPSPRRLSDLVIEADEVGFPLIEEQLVLLACDLPETVVQRSYPALWAYLQRGEGQGIRQRYLTSQRWPWYSQESRPPAPFLCTYMGRVGKRKPFRFFWNRSRAIAPNVYLMLYPRGALKKALIEEPGAEEIVFHFLQNIHLDDLTQNGRVYGGGLHKIEPSELGRVSAKGLLGKAGIVQESLTLQLELQSQHVRS